MSTAVVSAADVVSSVIAVVMDVSSFVVVKPTRNNQSVTE